MDKQWWEYLIDALITLLATGLGVYGAFIVDNLRDNKAKRDLRQRLIRGLTNEVTTLETFLEKTFNLQTYNVYFIEVRILEDTVKDQIDYLENEELFPSLSNLRLLTKKINYTLGLWADLNWKPQPNQGNITLRQEWGGLRDEAMKEIKTIKALLEKEDKSIPVVKK